MSEKRDRENREAKHDAYFAAIEEFQSWCMDRGLSYQWAASQALRAWMGAPIEKIPLVPDARATPRKNRRPRPGGPRPGMIARLESAKKLLINTDLPLIAIAKQIGFTAPCNLSIAFKKFTRQTPTQFRAANRKGAFTDERSAPT